MISMTACSSSKNNPVHLGVNAVITEIDEGNSTITVKDGAEEGILGKNCLIDCSSIPMIYCDYDTGQVVSISFEDLQVQDEIILSTSQTHECAPQPHHILNSKIIKT